MLAWLCETMLDKGSREREVTHKEHDYSQLIIKSFYCMKSFFDLNSKIIESKLRLV